jgi:hypothetical protein
MDDFQVKRLGKFRQRIVISVLGFIYVGGEFFWTGELLSYISVLEEKIKWRSSYLNETDYRLYYTYWQYRYELIKIL